MPGDVRRVVRRVLPRKIPLGQHRMPQRRMSHVDSLVQNRDNDPLARPRKRLSRQSPDHPQIGHRHRRGGGAQGQQEQQHVKHLHGVLVKIGEPPPNWLGKRRPGAR